MDTTRVRVLVVGAGLAGAATSMFLTDRGIDTLVVERHPGTSLHPKAAGQHPRTMELLRTAGVADRVNTAASADFEIKIVTSARGAVLKTITTADDPQPWNALSPLTMGMATQVQLEPIMLDRARENGARVRFDTELVSFDQDTLGVTARLVHRPTGTISQVRADYLVAADGHRSPIREQLGIGRHGWGSLSSHAGILFDADPERLADVTGSLYYLRNPEFTGVFTSTHIPGRFIFTVEYDPARGQSIDDFTPERCAELIRLGLDDPGLPLRLQTVQAWEMAARVADTFRSGRVFLAGDAAKVTPPTGGLGGNTAVADGFDIAWKLAAVLGGQAGPGLLDSYDPERRAFAEAVVAESLANYVDRMAPHLRSDAVPKPVGYLDLVFGFRQRSEAVVIDDEDPAPTENPLEPTGRPGFRAPHVPLLRDGAEVSTVDFFGRDWVLLTGTEGGVWHEAAKHVADRLGIAVRTVGLGPDLTDPADRLVRAYGIGHGGASLVRPDGVVAWRTDFDVADAAGTLQNVLSRLLDRAPVAAVPAGTAH
ncbi:aklavinone 12-hydroxylase RdmE [Kutzneria buriramensis]|uniref:Aklavinone 12-hydroxylase n=1 Tax=Kutzneria buriramensis TaxID=1045776 RepID=A0A3E0IBE5_9PSEU|nr:FAD-dependent monooxygenase [Kutzneria buriramensis]REH55911.1 aklavinone 12-hydroxylase [Kutzneria buriramensis]